MKDCLLSTISDNFERFEWNRSLRKLLLHRNHSKESYRKFFLAIVDTCTTYDAIANSHRSAGCTVALDVSTAQDNYNLTWL